MRRRERIRPPGRGVLWCRGECSTATRLTGAAREEDCEGEEGEEGAQGALLRSGLHRAAADDVGVPWAAVRVGGQAGGAAADLADVVLQRALRAAAQDVVNERLLS